MALVQFQFWFEFSRHPAGSYAEHAVTGGLGPGWYVAAATGGAGSRVQAEAAALPGGPAEAGPAGPKAPDQGEETHRC